MKHLNFFLVLLLVLSSLNIEAQVPRIISYQGMLMGSNEEQVPEGNYKMTFSLYEEDGTQLWSAVYDPVFIAGGLFQVHLEVPPELSFDHQYFLGIKVGDDQELQPRMLLTSAAYAIRAADADQLSGYGLSPTPRPETLLPLDHSGKFPASVLPAETTLLVTSTTCLK